MAARLIRCLRPPPPPFTHAHAYARVYTHIHTHARVHTRVIYSVRERRLSLETVRSASGRGDAPRCSWLLHMLTKTIMYIKLNSLEYWTRGVRVYNTVAKVRIRNRDKETRKLDLRVFALFGCMSHVATSTLPYALSNRLSHRNDIPAGNGSRIDLTSNARLVCPCKYGRIN